MRAGAPLVEETIDGLAPTDAAVLIRGESGVERGRVARTLHEGSRRRDQPFVTVNCAALPFELLESEIFGYESGAFTGAHRRKPGKIEAAQRNHFSTIEALPRPLQAKPLRVLRMAVSAARQPGGSPG
jgi:transcriptional regulator with PAS, ATPase and Fis domain